MQKIAVMVSGAAGRMGREVIKAVAAETDLELVGAVDVSPAPDAGSLAGIQALGVPVKSASELAVVLASPPRPEVMVDFTVPWAAKQNALIALRAGVRPVVGTTGMSREDIAELDTVAAQKKLGAVVAPNFAIGAVLMMHLAQVAAPHMRAVEIIELHHDRKLDAPSGTALRTAELLSPLLGREEAARAGQEGPRGQSVGGIQVHSVRLPGLVAHQAVIFGGVGETLTIRHDSVSRECFMPGVIRAVRAVIHLDRLVVGLETILGLV